jgi:hypothetical protein
MEYLFLGINIALLFGSLGGLIAVFALPFLASMIVKNRNKLEEMERLSDSQEELQNEVLNRLQRQVDGIESDLERAKLSSLAQPVGLAGRKGRINVSAKELKAKNIQDSVFHLTNTKQGGKRANKSRNK